MEIISTPLFFRSLENLYSFDSWEQKWGNAVFRTFFVKNLWNVQCGLPVLALYSVFRVNGRYWAFLSHNQGPVTPPPPPKKKLLYCQWNFLKSKCHLNIRRKYRPWAYILGFIELPYFGSEQFSADIFGWMYLYLYLYLNRCICICILIKLEQNICICIWKIEIFVFVFVFDKTYLTPALIAAANFIAKCVYAKSDFYIH